jgi:hypothetical protein
MTTETTTLFETGATTAASNNLVLSVLNDGSAYPDRLHCGFSMLQGSSHRLSFRDLANNEAIKQRAQGCKFRAADISEAAKLIQDRTIEHVIETIRDEWDGSKIECIHRKWWDKQNGNTYWSTKIIVPTSTGHHWIAVPFQYGYGNQWEHDCRQILERMGFEGMAEGCASEKPISFVSEGWMNKNRMYSGIHI